MLFLRCSNDRNIADEVYRSNTGDIKNHAGKAELPIFISIAHASEQDNTRQTQKPTGNKQIAGTNRGQEEGNDEVDDAGGYA